MFAFLDHDQVLLEPPAKKPRSQSHYSRCHQASHTNRNRNCPQFSQVQTDVIDLATEQKEDHNVDDDNDVAMRDDDSEDGCYLVPKHVLVKTNVLGMSVPG